MSKYGKKAVRKFRYATWRSRSLPDFIIIGAQKSGTTSLYAYLAQHPQLVPSFVREIHFFDGGLDSKVDTFKKGKGWYRGHFPIKKAMNADSKTYEGSPLYFFNPLCPRRIFDLVPNVKIVVLLRNPTERAISHYFHTKRKGHETLPIYTALQEEENRLEPILKNKDYKNNFFIRHSYKSRGLYKIQLERFLKYFSREQICILGSEDFFREPEISLKRVFHFLGVDKEWRIADLTPRNITNNKVDIDPAVREYLDDYFLPHNKALYDFVGKDFGWNKSDI